VNFLLRVFLVIAGLIFAASLAVVMLILLLAWAVRALWFKLTGRSVSPFVMRMNPRAGFDQVFRQGSRDSGHPPRRKLDDVTDVEPKP
jgi:flagellar biosynthesis protein FlhB